MMQEGLKFRWRARFDSFEMTTENARRNAGWS